MFVDRVKIHVAAGNGGNGCVSFRREKYVPNGGPDGGDGGHGGSVIFLAEEGVDSLSALAHRQHWKAERGEAGSGANCHGRSAEDLILRVPPGTVVKDADTDLVLKDLAHPGDSVIAARGGRGGKGNLHFKTSINRAPREAQPGEEGERRNLSLELKVIADVGLLGLPNAGKSTLISVVSAARPKIADYPFTTLHPNLGVVACGNQRSFVMADIPGLIEGAADGAGLGIRFLKHLQRTRVLLHLVDISPVDPNADPVRDARSIVAELIKFSDDLEHKPRWLVLNKSDLLPPDEAQTKAIAIAQALDYRGPAFLISGVTRSGTAELTEAVMRFLETAEAPAQGNLPLPTVKAASPAKRKAKAKAKSRAKPKPKPKPKSRSSKQKTRR